MASTTTDFVLSDAEWYAHRFVESDDSFRFVRLGRGEHAEIPFLTEAYLGTGRAAVDVPAGEILGVLGKGRAGFLFHSAFCGSTLLTRAFDRPGLAMGLSEPVALNDIVGFRRRKADPRAVARAADAACRLLARPFGGGEMVIVKPSNIVNPLAELLLALQPDAPTLFLYAPLETFLISVARKGLECRLWVRELLEAYLRDGMIELGFSPDEYFRQTDLQIAAVGWLAQHALFARLAAKLGPGRLRTLDANRLAADPAAALAAAAAHYGLALAPDALEEIVTGPAFARHSKSGVAFTAADRATEYAAARTAHGEEIDKVMVWAEAVAKAAGIDLTPPHPLIG